MKWNARFHGRALLLGTQTFFPMSVRTTVGATEFVWMLNGPHSAAMTRVNMLSPPLAEL